MCVERGTDREEREKRREPRLVFVGGMWWCRDGASVVEEVLAKLDVMHTREVYAEDEVHVLLLTVEAHWDAFVSAHRSALLWLSPFVFSAAVCVEASSLCVLCSHPHAPQVFTCVHVLCMRVWM